MGTRSLTVVKDGTLKTKDTIVLYRQFDGYPTGHGKELQDFLSPIRLINGISGNEKLGAFANGMGCLAAQLVAHFKTEIGGFYLYPSGTRDAGEEFIYTLYEEKDQIHLLLQAGAVTYFGAPGTKQENMPALFQGPIADFDPDREENGYKKLREDIPNDFTKKKSTKKVKRTRKQTA